MSAPAPTTRQPIVQRVPGIVVTNGALRSQKNRTGIQAGVHLHDRDAGDAVSGHDRALDRRSAPPTREQ